MAGELVEQTSPLWSPKFNGAIIDLFMKSEFASFKYGRIDEMSDAEDIRYWQARSDEDKFKEAWRLVELFAQLKGLTKDELRFQRSVASLQRQPS